ncbi:MAG: hypothetical protein ACYCXP_06790 [Leptospirillum sp.]
MSADPNSVWLKWIKILTVEFDFPISEETDLKNSASTPYILLPKKPQDPTFYQKTEPHEIWVRLILENRSRFFTAEGCRVHLTSIKIRDNPRQGWRSTEYKENNQIAWAEKQFEFETVDIFPLTSRAIEPLILCPEKGDIKVRVFKTHFSFDYIFPTFASERFDWKFSFLAVGKNISPTSFELILELLGKDSDGVGMPFFQVNGCKLEVEKLYVRNHITPEELEKWKNSQREKEKRKKEEQYGELAKMIENYRHNSDQ